MRITLDPSLKQTNPRSHDLASWMDRLAASVIPYEKRRQVVFLHADLPEATEHLHRGYVGLLAEAYSRHEKVRVAPHDLWFLVLTQLAKAVNKDPGRYRPLFTTSAEKVEISVPTDDVTTIDPTSLIEQLAACVPTDVTAFLPALSTADATVVVAMHAAFCDVVQSYYDYTTFLCGIPELEVTGTIADWSTLMLSATALSSAFLNVGATKVVAYLAKVHGIFATIANEVLHETLRAQGQDVPPNLDFWRGIFTARNLGSGGELEVKGWIRDLFLEQPQLAKLENFTTTYAVLPYRNLETGRRFQATYGAFSQLRSPDGVLYAGYGHLTHERLKGTA